MKRFVEPAVSFGALLLLWHVAAELLAGTYLLAGPGPVFSYMIENAGLLARATGETLQNAAWGFLWGNLAAAALAMLVVLVPRSERVIAALALVVFCLPLVATGPILRVLYGTGTGPQITLAALAVFYTSFLAMRVGLRAVPASWMDLVQTYGRGAGTAFWVVRAPAAVPYTGAALQIAAPAAVLGAIIGEFTGAERGLGMLTIRALRSLDVEATWAIATIASLAAIAAHLAVGWVITRLRMGAPALLLSPPPPPRARYGPRRAGAALAVIAAPLVLWQGAMMAFDLNRFFAKRPFDVFTYLFADPQAEAHRDRLFEAFAATLAYTVPGYLTGLALGALLACAIVLAPRAAGLAMPLAIALRSIPIVTTAPLIVLALGRGAAGIITIVAVMIFFPTLVACLQGLRQVPPQISDVFGTYAAGRFRVLMLARIPAMLPAFFATARMAVPAAILAVTTAEWLATGQGIGSLMALTASTSDYNMLWSAIALVALAAALAHGGISMLEAVVLRRYAPEQTR